MQPLTIIFTLVILFGLFYVFNNGRPTKKETTTTTYIIPSTRPSYLWPTSYYDYDYGLDLPYYYGRSYLSYYPRYNYRINYRFPTTRYFKRRAIRGSSSRGKRRGGKRRGGKRGRK